MWKEAHCPDLIDADRRQRIVHEITPAGKAPDDRRLSGLGIPPRRGGALPNGSEGEHDGLLRSEQFLQHLS